MDCNPRNLWEKVVSVDETVTKPLDRFRVFQSQITMIEQQKGDSGLEVIPGFYRYAEKYFTLTNQEKLHCFNPRLAYNRKFCREHDQEIIDCFVACQRMPEDWSAEGIPENEWKLPTGEENKRQIVNFVKKVHFEHRKLKFVPTQPGDMILWEMRTAHKNGDKNETEICRQTFYVAFLAAIGMNEQTVIQVNQSRKTGQHPPDFKSKYSNIEMEGYTPLELDELGKRLYGEEKWEEKPEEKWIKAFPVTERHIEFFKRFGYVSLSPFF